MSNLTDKWKALKKWQKTIIIIASLAAVGALVPAPEETQEQLAIDVEEQSKADSIKAEKEAIQAKKDKLISAYIIAKNSLKQSMKNPDSFDEKNRSYYYLTEPTADGATIQVIIEYSGTNSFGGTVWAKQGFEFADDLVLVNTVSL